MKKTISIRIDEELLKQADVQAKDENRNRTNLIETALLEYLKARGYKNKI